MKVSELVEKYNKNQRIDLVKVLEVIPYTGIEFKRQMANLVLDGCTTIVDGEVHIDSLEKYLLFTISVISMHTNLEFSHEDEDDMMDAIDDYDMLCESGLLVKIIETFKDDYAACQEVLNMMTADKIQNSMTLEKKICTFLDAIQNMLGNGINNLTENLDVSNLINDLPIDQSKLIKLLGSLKQD